MHASCVCHASQTCLSGQLKDLYQQDEQRIKQGRVPLHMLTQFSGGDDSQVRLRWG